MAYKLSDIRESYKKSVSNAQVALSFWQSLKNYKGSEGPILAYKAAALAFKAKYDWNPLNKFNWLNECMEIFKKAIRADKDNVEIRFLRFAIQHSMPDFLQQSNNLKRDKAIILKNFGRYKEFDLDDEQLLYFHGFFEDSRRFSSEELYALKNIIHHNQ